MSLNEAERTRIIKELSDFREKLIELWNLANTMLESALKHKKRWADFQALRRELLQLQGHLGGIIIEYGGPAVKRSAFSEALTPINPDRNMFVGLQAIEAATLRAIGKLQSLPLSSAEAQDAASIYPPKAFIAHGGESARLRKVCEFLEALGVEPVIAEWSASEGRWTEENVDRRMEDSDCDIILAEYGGIVDIKTGAKHPRLNVIDELGRSRQKRPNRTILLLEKSISLPSNVSGIVYEHFTKRNMEKAFIKVARELKAFGIIKAVKPQ